MTAESLLNPLLSELLPFILFIAIGLLGMAILHMIGKGNV